MTYVEEMALRAWNECHGIARCEGTKEITGHKYWCSKVKKKKVKAEGE